MVFGTLPIPDLYVLPEWLLDEFRFVVAEYNKHKADS